MEITKGGPDDRDDELDYYKKVNVEKEKTILELHKKLKEAEEEKNNIKETTSIE